MGSGTKDLSKDMASGKVYRMIPTQGNGTHQKLTAMECTPGPTETGMRVSGKCASSMAMEPIHLIQGTSILANTSMASLKAKESIDGQMDKYILENSIRG